jgi:hypothetical protein
MTTNALTVKQNHPGSGQRPKALIAARPVLGAAASRVERIPWPTDTSFADFDFSERNG